MTSIGIQSIHLYRFKLHLAAAFTVPGGSIREREGVVIHVISENGDMGFGEVAPLPGIHPETFSHALYQSGRMAEDLRGTRAPLEARHLLPWLSDHMPATIIPTTVKFGFESAVVAMIAAAQDKPICEFLAPGSSQAIVSSGHLQGDLDQTVRQARFLSSKGYTLFELDISGRNMALAVQKIDGVRAVIGPNAKLRLNAGREWTFDEVLLFARHVGKDRIEYLAEPLADPARLEDLFRQTDIPLAVDKTLTEPVFIKLAEREALRYALIRPTNVNGLSGCLNIIHNLREWGIEPVMTSCLESGVGMTTLVNLAMLCGLTANFGSANLLEEDLLLRPFITDNGCIPPDRLILMSKFFHPAFAAQLKVT